MCLFLADDQDIEAKVKNLGLLGGRGKTTSHNPCPLLSTTCESAHQHMWNLFLGEKYDM